MYPDFDIVIPARYESSRFPGKLLAVIHDKTMIHRVVERAFLSSAKRVVVAVDDDRIAHEVSSKTDAVVCHTSKEHPSGTDRVAEAAEILQLDENRIVVNVQGDEPLIPPTLIDKVAMKLSDCSDAGVSTAAKPLMKEKDWKNLDIVKCVLDQNGYALYFSRAPVPAGYMDKQRKSQIRLHHIGIYAYRTGYLKAHAKRPVCELESIERLEQLRVLYNGDRIAVHIDDQYTSQGVDTPADLRRVERLIIAQEEGDD